MNNANGKKRNAFTLIELLIVVAIIAILAAIAVPNFLEAQVRSKVSRVKADQRSLATAVESYSVDCNTPPPGAWTFNSGGCNCLGLKLATRYNDHALSLLTTPIAYITQILLDPFVAKSGNISVLTSTPGRTAQYYYYQDFGIPTKAGKVSWRKTYCLGYTWAVYSPGPSRNQPGDINLVLRGENNTNPGTTECAYDPSNGTMSVGWILRTNKGVFAAPGS